MFRNPGPVTRTTRRSTLSLAAAAGCAVGINAAQAQMSWLGGTGNWNVASNWSPTNVPDNTGETATIAALGAYTVTVPAATSVGALAISNSTALLNINTGINMGMGGGGLANDSTVTLNATGGGSGTSWQALGSHAWTGSGAFVLNASTNIETATITWNGGGEVITQDASHTLRGTGRVYAFFVNNGVINADRSGRVLWLTNQGKTNNNLMTATNDGFLDIATSVNQTGGGRIEADGGAVRFQGSASINGGQINILPGGTGQIIGATTWTNVSLSGPLSIATGHTLGTNTSLVNTGVLTINATAGGAGTSVQLINSTALSGSGSLELNASTNLETATIIWNGGGEVLTQAADHTIRGTGRIYTFLTNNGAVSADVPGRVLWLTNQTKTNNNVMTATGGAFLDVSCAVNQGPSGRIQAVNGTVRHSSAVVTGGLLSASGTGIHSITGGSRWNSVTLSGPASMETGHTLQIADALTNNGSILVNRTEGGAGTVVQVMNSLAVSGTGTISLNAASGNLETAILHYNGGGEVLTLGAGQVVRGTGRVYVNTTNNGLIHADVNTRTLQLLGQPKSNNATMKASGGGILSILNIGVTQAALAELLADGGELNCSGATINGGLVRAINGGQTVISSGSRFNGVTTSGPLNINTGITLQIADGLTNNGTCTINTTGGGGSTVFQVLNSQNLAGSGQVVLNATIGNLDTAILTYNGGGEVLTQAPTHTIRGTGNIYVNLLNNGLVHADRANRVLQLLSQPKANNTVMKATGGGILAITNCAVSQPPAGQVLADGGDVRLSGAGVTGGQINATNGGLVTVTGNSTVSGVTTSGPMSVNNGVNLSFTGGLTNNGEITVNPTSGGSGTLMQCLSSQTLSGTGAVVLNASSNLDTAYLTYAGGGEVLTHAATHTIRGTGNIYVSIANNGLVDADVAGRTLQLLGIAKTNNAVMRATNGGALAVTNVALTQSPTGQVLANGGNVRLSGATVNGGQLNATGGGVTQVTGNSRFNAVTTAGPLETNTGTSLQIADGLSNNGTVLINATAGASGTLLQCVNSQTLSGSGSVLLNSTSNFDTAYIIYIRTHNDGILSPGRPGTPIGQLDLRGLATLTFGATGEFHCQLAGAGDANADRITGDRAIAIDGTMVVSLVAPYMPNRDEEWTVISGGSVTGFFTELLAPAAVNGVGYKLEYFTNRVVLRTVCYADVNNDGGIDGSDVQAFFELWEAGDPVSDLNNDGGIDGADVETFFAYWEGGGC
jgi:hypothetical protein